MDEVKINYPAIFYDNQCELCRRYKLALTKLDTSKIFSFYSIHNEEIYKHINVTKEELHKEVHVFENENSFHRGSEAINFIVGHIPGASKFSWLIESEMGQKAINYFHQASEKYRQALLKRCHSCKK